MEENGWMAKARALVRPIVTLSGWAVITYLVVEQLPIPDWYQVVVVGFTTWWFATRKNNSST